jgi:threonine dehydrogenase-like Zn-dependent dehydrogenase
MKAVCWHGKGDMRVDNVPDPKIEAPTDAIIRITTTGICGSDLHLYNGLMAGMKSGDVIGHEPMGEVIEVGSAVANLKRGDRVVVPFTISCGKCYFCEQHLYSLCDTTNPNAEEARKLFGHSTAGLFGYSHIMGGFPGGQAEYLRVPHANVGPIKIPDGIPDDQVVFLSDIFPTGYMAVENCGLKGGETIAIWGCGPVAQFAIQSAWMLGAGRVIAIDDVPERLQMARDRGKAETINFGDLDVYETLMAMTNGRGPDACVDAVGAEAHTSSAAVTAYDKTREAARLPRNRPFALNEAIKCCRKGGTVSVPGVYTDAVDNVFLTAFVNKALTLKTGQTHVQRYLKPLLDAIVSGKIDPSFVITDSVGIDEAPDAYARFNAKKDGCIKVVLKP